MQVTNSLQFGTTTIEYHLDFAARETVAINVHPDQLEAMAATLQAYV